MIPQLRRRYNRAFTPDRYERFLRRLDETVGCHIEFRVAETPVFLPAALLDEMVRSAHDLIRQLSTAQYRELSSSAVPSEFNVPGEDAHPLFVVVDFAVVREDGGSLVPRLIELQGFPSLYGFQLTLNQVFPEIFEEAQGLGYLLEGIDLPEYERLLNSAIRAGHDPENVVLMDIHPETQKTRPDFLIIEKLTGVPSVCVTEMVKRGRRLYYRRDGREIPIHRIFNRLIVDEFVRKKIRAQFDLREDLDVEWAGHPNWYFRWSKYSLPYLRHSTVPEARFLADVQDVPEDLSPYVLKPLYSFAGVGVKVDVTRADLENVPVEQRRNYLLQRKVAYGGVIETPDEPSKVEVRIMFIWDDRPRAVLTLARLSKGKMMGVDFNKNKEWVGSSCCFYA